MAAEISIDVTCECGTDLTVNWKTSRGMSWLEVEPCETCMQKREDAGYDEGYKHGHDEGQKEGAASA